jgi:hypothetical protein
MRLGLRSLAALLFLMTIAGLAPAAPTVPGDQAAPNARDMDAVGPPTVASVDGKYRGLLRILYLPEDERDYKRFYEWGMWNGTEWKQYKNLPAGHWVYVYPNWYIWRECVRPGGN